MHGDSFLIDTLDPHAVAGRYLPALSDEILRQNRLIDKGRRRNGIRFPLKAILIGNGWTDPKTQLAHYHTFGCDNDNECK